jgi:hypothetical protein
MWGNIMHKGLPKVQLWKGACLEIVGFIGMVIDYPLSGKIFQQSWDICTIQDTKKPTGGGGIVRGRDRMVVGITTNCAIGAYDH